jgi:two-component system OmpR family sensor kinase/two-component system sensor histidine kinase QseC
MTSIRTRLLVVLLSVVAVASLLAGLLTYRRVLAETSTLFDYQLRQMALSLRTQVSLAPRIELPPDQGDTDFVIQIWDLFGARVYLSRPGLPIIDRITLGYSDLPLQGSLWRAYGLQAVDGVIQVAQPVRVREVLARRAALHVLIPLLLFLPLLGLAIATVVRSSLLPLRRVATEVQQRDAHSLTAIATMRLPKEVTPLILELNRLLGRLAAAFATERAFIADAAHELRSPLTAVSIHLQLLDRAPDESARLEARANLGAAVQRAIHLIEQLLILARNEPRDAGDELRPVALEACAAEGISDSHALAVARNTDLGLDAEANITVLGDREALRTLVRNLVDNAVRYSPVGARVLVRCHNSQLGVRLEVLDTGPGIPIMDRERAFDRFYRRASAPEGGSGLGLAIVKAIADRHRAQLTLDEAPGGGLRVTVAFPPLA